MMNPLLEPSQAPFGAPQFDKIKKEHYMPAFREAIRMAKAEIDAIVANPEKPSFSNTVEALEYAGSALAGVEGIFFNLLEAESDKEMQNIAEEVSPLLTEFEMYVSLNDALFQRVRTVHDAPGELDPEQKKLLDDTYKGFLRGGAALEGDARDEYSRLCEELSLAELAFGNNVLAATHAFVLHLTEESDLAGLPAYVREMGAAEASQRGMEGWVYTLDRPSYTPFMKYSTRRDLREKFYREYDLRAVGGEHDNTGIILKIVRLRHRIAQLLGFRTYADYALDNRMAKTVGTVNGFLQRLLEPSMPKAREELAEILEYAKARGFEGSCIENWDFFYWSERLREEKFSLGEEQLKPYFRLENVIDAVLGLASRLYGLEFEERHDIPVYHPDVKVFEVKDENGGHLALFYADFFPRPGKRGGAWMTEFRGQQIRDGKDLRPFISIVTNFSKPSPGTPSLLTHDELTTFLHEFGHSLHGMLSRGRYPSMCGTNVARDFVELPSQILENWGYEKEYLDTFARHYQTGETIPEDYVRSIVASKNYLAGYLQLRQLRFGIIDMAWHTLESDFPSDAVAFERHILDPCQVLPPVEGCAVCPSFGHIFSGGYSAGYYSYKWAELLEADAFELFREKGIFDKETASRFRREILERGSSCDEDVLYRNFRGHDPDPDALLRKMGMI